MLAEERFSRIHIKMEEQESGEYLITVTLPKVTLDDPEVDIDSLKYMFQEKKANDGTVSGEALFVPVIIMGGILLGIFTPTESAAIASLVAAVEGMFVFHKLKWKDFPKILEGTAVISAAILVIVAMANILAYTMSLAQLPQQIANFLISLTDSKVLLLLLINLFLLLVGCVMESFADLLLEPH